MTKNTNMSWLKYYFTAKLQSDATKKEIHKWISFKSVISVIKKLWILEIEVEWELDQRFHLNSNSTYDNYKNYKSTILRKQFMTKYM